MRCRLAAHRHGLERKRATCCSETGVAPVYLLAFATESCFDTETCCDQLRSLWTAYCLHNRLDVDTRDYDLTLLKVWEVVSVEEEDNAYWSSFDSFDDFMCSWLV